MNSPDLNDLLYFAAVVRHRGFSAAARATGIEKTRLSRRVAELEKRLGVRLLQRSTRSIRLSEAGERFYERCAATVEEAEAAYASIADLRREPAGTVRMACPPVLAQNYLAPILPAYLAAHPKVCLHIEPTERAVDLIEERFDLALLATPQVDAAAGIVVRQLGSARRILVAAPAFLERCGRPAEPGQIAALATLGKPPDGRDGTARWELADAAGTACVVGHYPRLQTHDLRLQFESALSGLGIALLPEPIVAASIRGGLLEHVLPGWSAVPNAICLAYPGPRGILPSVRSVLDHLALHLPALIAERSVLAGSGPAPA